MLESNESEAQATDRIVDIETDETVGFLYVWEDGVQQALWLDGARGDVLVTELQKSE